MSAIGILAFVVAAAAIVAGSAAVAARLFPPPRAGAHRAVTTAIVALAAPIAVVRILALGYALVPLAAFAALVAAGVAMAAVAGRDARALARRDARVAVRLVASAFTGASFAPAAWVGAAALGAAGLAAMLLAPWAWDALGYHLPIVHDALQTRTLRDVPTSVVYVNAYPRAIETFFVACRLLLGNDTWLDFCQAPFGVAAVVVIAATARRAGASVPRAIAYGAMFLAVPVVALQLATSYVDVAYAALLLAAVYFATGPLTRADLAMWALSTGTLLDCKPVAPPAVALLGAVVLVRAWREGRARGLASALVACVAVVAIGASRYIENVLAHGNPVWPVGIALGPVRLPGDDSGPMYVQGLPPALAHAGWLHRVAVSIVAQPSRYLYDMRYGGLGPLVAFGVLPLAVAAVVRPRARGALLAAALGAACALAMPAAHWTRFMLAFPGALLALAAVVAEGARPRVRIAADLGLALLAAIGLVRALPGFTDGGPSLVALAALSPEARARAVSLDLHETDWDAARARVGDGEAFAYDRTFSLPGQLWRSDGRARLTYIADETLEPPALLERLARDHVRILVAGEGGAADRAVQADRDAFRPLFRCPLDACVVYERLDRAPAQAAR